MSEKISNLVNIKERMAHRLAQIAVARCDEAGEPIKASIHYFPEQPPEPPEAA